MTPASLLAALAGGTPVPGRHLVVTAHPDDETIACGGALQLFEQVTLFQLTVGAHDLADTGRLTQRLAERTAALSALGVQVRVVDGITTDRGAHLRLPWLLDLLGDAIEFDRIEAIWTHPYEHGHVDHDTAAWLVHWMCRDRPEIHRMEFASYHATATGDAFGVFAPCADAPSARMRLTGQTLARKRAALAAYDSQAHILRKFRHPEIEEYRAAPRYDFAQPAPVPRARWDVKGYQPSTATWRQAMWKDA